MESTEVEEEDVIAEREAPRSEEEVEAKSYGEEGMDNLEVAIKRGTEIAEGRIGGDSARDFKLKRVKPLTAQSKRKIITP